MAPEMDDVGSRLRLTEPARKDSCRMVIRRERIASRGIRGRSRESISVVSVSKSRIRRRTDRREDFPL